MEYKSITAFHSLSLPLDAKVNTSKRLWGVKTRNAKPPRKISKGRLFYLQVENLCQVNIYSAQHTEAEGAGQEDQKLVQGRLDQSRYLRNSRWSQLCGAGVANTALV